MSEITKNTLEKLLFFDAHFHYSGCIENPGEKLFSEKDYLEKSIFGCNSMHGKDDVESAFCTSDPAFINSFGIHPQNPDEALVPLLENLLEQKKIFAVGECGFDCFNEEFKSQLELQKKVFEIQFELAEKYSMPLVIHGRKANEILFTYSKQLKKLPAVLFHSFMGSVVEAESFINRGINAYFSFGRQIFNGNKKVIQNVRELPLKNLLLETDAPFQFLKGESCTGRQQIKDVYEGAYKIRSELYKNRQNSFEEFAGVLRENFIKCFCIQ